MLEQCALGDARYAHDLGGGGARVAELGEAGEGGLEQGALGLIPAFLLGAASSRGCRGQAHVPRIYRLEKDSDKSLSFVDSDVPG